MGVVGGLNSQKFDFGWVVLRCVLAIQAERALLEVGAQSRVLGCKYEFDVAGI